MCLLLISPGKCLVDNCFQSSHKENFTVFSNEGPLGRVFTVSPYAAISLNMFIISSIFLVSVEVLAWRQLLLCSLLRIALYIYQARVFSQSAASGDAGGMGGKGDTRAAESTWLSTGD